LLKADPSTIKINDPGPQGAVTISTTLEGTPFTATLNEDYRPASISLSLNGRTIELVYSDYRDLAEYGVKPRYARRPVELPADLEAVKRAVFG